MPTPIQHNYSVRLVAWDETPVISQRDGSSAFFQAFNPSWIAPSPVQPHSGLLVRVQNCSAEPGVCTKCTGSGARASRLAFARLIDDTEQQPRFLDIDNGDIVFAPHDSMDDLGVEDPRVVFDHATGRYVVLYTCYNSGHAPPPTPHVSLCFASTSDPTSPSGWTRHGSVGLGEGSKSGALLMNPRHGGEHYLYWGSGRIRLSRSRNLSAWSLGQPFINGTRWGNPLVEPGPPPLKLSTGDYLMLFNSWDAAFPKAPGYQPGWAILDGNDPSRIIAQAEAPLWSPQRADWMTGAAPALCNVPNVAFVSAAQPTERRDTYRVYFGGADAVVGTAVVEVRF